MRPAPRKPPSEIERYVRALRFELEQKDLSRLDDVPTGELVLLLSSPDGSEKRVVVRIEAGTISVSEQAANHYVPQAVVECLLTHWIEYVQTGKIVDLDGFELFGSLDVLDAFFSIHRLAQRPVSLRCHNMTSGKRPNARSARH